VNLVYIISAYRLPEQLVRLVTRLRTENATFLVHVDKKAPQDVLRRVAEGVSPLPEVHLLDRHVCNWGGFGHVAVSLEAIGEIVENGIPCDYAVLLTGQDFPLKSNDEIKARLERHRGFSFLSWFPVPANEEWLPDGGLDRIDRWYFWVRERSLQVPSTRGQGRLGQALTLISGVMPRRRFLPGLRPYGGSSYWCLSGDAVSFVHRYVRDHPEVVAFFRRVFIPDELFFQTILVNSELRGGIVNDDLRYMRWTATGAGPEVLRVDDFESLRDTESLFARKFDQGVDGRVLELIEGQLL
jgi:core-2/I-Branching enzyme